MANGDMKHNGITSTGEKQMLPSKSCPTVTSPQKIDEYYITSDNVENYLTVQPNKWYGNPI